METNDRKIICRKCGGPHFTMKCGKDKEAKPEPKSEPEIKTEPKPKSEPLHTNTAPVKRLDTLNKSRTTDTRDYRNHSRKSYRVKMSDMPSDITEEEMMELLSEWGHITRLRVLNYPESSTVYVDFGYEEEADYFVKALHSTPFEHVIINVTRVPTI